MIAAAAELAVAWLPCSAVVFGEPQPCDLGTVATYAQLMRDAGDQEGHLAPVLVNPDPRAAGRFTVRDGHHRLLAHLVLGRARVRCVIVGPAGRPGPTGGLPDIDE